MSLSSREVCKNGPEVNLQNAVSVHCAPALPPQPCGGRRRRRGQPTLAPGSVGVHCAQTRVDEAALREAAHLACSNSLGVLSALDVARQHHAVCLYMIVERFSDDSILWPRVACKSEGVINIKRPGNWHSSR